MSYVLVHPLALVASLLLVVLVVNTPYDLVVAFIFLIVLDIKIKNALRIMVYTLNN